MTNIERRLRIRELDASPADIAYLHGFYEGVFTEEFPDPDERESIENMQRYLELRDNGWYGRNNYHIVIAELDGKAVGGAVFDYFEKPNAGVLEFLFLRADARGQGFGRFLLDKVERILELDARTLTSRPLDWIVAEMNDPFIRSDVPDNMDPFERAEIWSRWGYGILDFPYVQPALSDTQNAVENLGLICKSFREEWKEEVPAEIVRVAIAEYLRLAMRIEEPDDSTDYQKMRADLQSRARVRKINLARYVGGRDARPETIVDEILDADAPGFHAAMEIYEESFTSPSAAVTRQCFERALRDASTSDRIQYHLWALHLGAAARPEGIASFFTTDRCGFGGYVAFRAPMRRTGRSALLLARIERAMMGDQPKCRGWYIECESTTDVSPFTKFGFREIQLPYAQPDLAQPKVSGPTVRLFYKNFGRVYDAPLLKRNELLGAIEVIFRDVYAIQNPIEHPTYRVMAEAMTGLASDLVPITD